MLVVIALSVAAFPEGLPVVLITTLASGAYEMAKKNAIVNRMSILETLGEATVICADKTGTITTGIMTVKKILLGNRVVDVSGLGYGAHGDFVCDGKIEETGISSHLGQLLKTATICNDARIFPDRNGLEYRPSGSVTEAALLIAAAKAGISKEDLDFERIGEIPFTSERKAMYVLAKEKSDYYVYAKGAPEIIIAKCTEAMREDGTAILNNAGRVRLLSANERMTSMGFRTLALAYKKVGNAQKDGFEKELIFLGIVCIEDPPREGIEQALNVCRGAGIAVKMITGDGPNTAHAIADQIGLSGKMIEGTDIDEMSDEEFAANVENFTIFARTTPGNKLRIVRALKMKGDIVAMTGDGVNDAPALKEAHIGIAMGRRGTDVSREASDLILKDDNFTTIVYAVGEGRKIFANIRKFVAYDLSCNFAELAVILSGVLAGFPLVLSALQILLMNIVTDDLPSITLGLTPAAPDIMRRKPYKNPSILNSSMHRTILFSAALLAFGTLAIFYIVSNVLGQGINTSRTVALLTLVLFEIANAFNFRSFKKGVHETPLLQNRLLVYASLAAVLVMVFVIYGPINAVFGTTPINLTYWIGICIASISVIVMFDLLKMHFRGNDEILPKD